MHSDPFRQFLSWYDEAVHSGIKNPDAMTLATVSPMGVPSARIVLYKGLDSRGIRFFTNYLSRKGRELESNPHAAVVFYWSQLDRQIRIEGRVTKLTPEESEAYWRSRPRQSQLGGLVSPQSELIPDRQTLETLYDQLDEKYGNQPIPRPEHWGGYCLVPQSFEFWLSGEHRLHDRFAYSLKGTQWELVRLAP